MGRVTSAIVEPGTVLGGRFRLERRLERDWRGDIYAAQDERAGGRPSEVELIRLSGKQEEQVQRLVEREVEVSELWLKDVPDVLKALAWGQVGPGELFVARELLADGKAFEPSGGDLDGRVWQLLGAAQAVGELHQRGIVHRDLGPRSLIVGPDEKLRVARFALARLDEVAEPWAGPLGLPLLHLRCAAPEVLLRPSEADKRADVYSLGVLLFRALVGRWPYPGPSLAQLVQQQQAVLHRTALPPTETANLPASLRKACARALAIAPEERFASTDELVEALEAWLAVAPEDRAAEDARGEESDLGALDLTIPDDDDEPPPRQALPHENDLVVIAADDETDEEALEHSGLEGSDDAWVPEPEPAATVTPARAMARAAPPPASIGAPPVTPRSPLPRIPARSTPTSSRRPTDESDSDIFRESGRTPVVDPGPPPVTEEEPVPLDPEEAARALAEETGSLSAPLRPVDEVLPGTQRIGAVLVIPGSAKELVGRVRSLRQADLSDFLGVILDLRGATNMGGSELEALAEVKLLAEEREVAAGLLGVGKTVLQILTLMDMTPNVPRLLEAQEPEAAARELLE